MALLEAIGGKTVVVRGIPWLNGQQKEISAKRLSARVTCETHNNLAGPFDTAVTRLVKAVLAFNGGAWTRRDSAIRLLSGPDLERGLLKMLLSAGAAGWLQGHLGVVHLPKAHDQLAKIVYDNGSLVTFAGFHILQPREPRSGENEVALEPIFSTESPNHVIGLSVTLLGFGFALALVPTEDLRPALVQYADAWRRPERFVFRSGDCRKSILFSWPYGHGSDNKRPIFAVPHFREPAIEA